MKNFWGGGGLRALAGNHRKVGPLYTLGQLWYIPIPRTPWRLGNTFLSSGTRRLHWSYNSNYPSRHGAENHRYKHG